MNKRTKAKIAAFQRVQQRNGAYHISQFTPHEQAIREHVSRGFVAPTAHLANDLGLLDARNKI